MPVRLRGHTGSGVVFHDGTCVDELESIFREMGEICSKVTDGGEGS